MKCTERNGTGRSIYGYNQSCFLCNGSGIIEPMTNEEWLRSATTEELANILAIQKCDGCNDEPYDEEHSTCKYCMMQKREQIMEWLKEIHKE